MAVLRTYRVVLTRTRHDRAVVMVEARSKDQALLLAGLRPMSWQDDVEEVDLESIDQAESHVPNDMPARANAQVQQLTDPLGPPVSPALRGQERSDAGQETPDAV